MRLKYGLFIGMTILVSLLLWYYVIAFCGIYSSASIGWIYGSIAGLMLDWFAFSISIPLIRACLRLIIRKFKRLKFLIRLEYILWIYRNISG